MKQATDKYQYEVLTKAGFKVAPDLMWFYTTLKDRPNPYLQSYCETSARHGNLYICPAWSLSLLIESIPKVTSYGWFAIEWKQRSQTYFVGYQDDEGAFMKAFPQSDLLDAVYYTLLWTLENPEVVHECQEYFNIIKKGGDQ